MATNGSKCHKDNKTKRQNLADIIRPRGQQGLPRKDREQSIWAEGTACAKTLCLCMLLVGNHRINKSVTSGPSLSTKGQVLDVHSLTHQSQRSEMTGMATDRRRDK